MIADGVNAGRLLLTAALIILGELGIQPILWNTMIKRTLNLQQTVRAVPGKFYKIDGREFACISKNTTHLAHTPLKFYLGHPPAFGEQSPQDHSTTYRFLSLDGTVELEVLTNSKGMVSRCDAILSMPDRVGFQW